MISTRKKLLIFDLDGTIADTICSIRDAINLTMDKYGLPRRDYEHVKRSVGNGARELVRRCLPDDMREDAELAERAFCDYDELYEQTYANIDGCYDGMSEAIHSLYEKGYMIAVLSNKQDAYVKKIIEILFPDGIMSYVAGQTELPKKPSPVVPLMIAESLGVKPENCAFIGDSDVDVLTGKNAGMTSVGCSWGYRPRETLEGADFVIDSPAELMEIFK